MKFQPVSLSALSPIALFLAPLLLLASCASSPSRAGTVDASPLGSNAVHLAIHAVEDCELCELYASTEGWILRVWVGDQSGTGFVIDSKGRALSSARLIGDARKVRVEFSGGRSFDAEVLDIDEHLDLALLQLMEPGLTWTSAPLLAAAAQTDTEVYALGHPRTTEWALIPGIVRAATMIQGQSMLPISTRVPADYWGGPLLDALSNVVGLVTSRELPQDEIAHAEPWALVLPSEVLMEFIARTPSDD